MWVLRYWNDYKIGGLKMLRIGIVCGLGLGLSFMV